MKQIYRLILFLLTITFSFHLSGQELRIIGGNTINIETAPWQVRLIVKEKYYGGGVIIGDQWILTAKHCVHTFGMGAIDPDELKILAGISCLQESNNPINVIGYIVHPTADLALLKLETPIRFSTKAQKITLANAAHTPYIKAGASARATGWGYSTPDGMTIPECLQAIDLKLMRDEEVCPPYFEHGGVNPRDFIGTEGPGQLTGTSGGDSGGPLVMQINNMPVLIGIVSQGVTKNNKIITAYPRISAYYDWIIQEMNKNRMYYIQYLISNPSISPLNKEQGILTGKLGSTAFLEYNNENQSNLLGKNVQVELNIVAPYVKEEDKVARWEIISNPERNQILPVSHRKSLKVLFKEKNVISTTENTGIFMFRYSPDYNTYFLQKVKVTVNPKQMPSITIKRTEKAFEIALSENPIYPHSLKSGIKENTTKLPESGITVHYEIYNIYEYTGKVQQGKIKITPGEKNEINLTELRKGFYVINIYEGNKKIHSEKFKLD